MSHRSRKTGRVARGTRAESAFENALAGDEMPRRTPFDPQSDRKTLRLCQQVRRALMLALSGECGDDVLRELYVESVEPMGSAAHLLVRVAIPVGAAVNAGDLLAVLNERAPKLRAIIARSISRKRVPTVLFAIMPLAEPISEGGRP